MFSRWSNVVQMVGRDGVQLVGAVGRAFRTNKHATTKSILMEQALQNRNVVATSLLEVDREFGLVRYYGVSEYVRRRWNKNITNTSTGSNAQTTSLSSTDTNNDAAKVAFMITSSMKAELADRLGYEESQIKKMTPIQASLLLNNSVPSNEMEERLPMLEQSYEQQQEQEAAEREQKMEEERKAQEQQQVNMQQEQQTTFQSNPSQQNDPSIEQIHQSIDTPMSNDLNSDSYASSNLLSNDAPLHSKISGFGHVDWYEVVELEKDGGNSRVGLFTNMEEATLAMEVRQSSANAKGLKETYQVRPVSRDSL